MRPIKLRLRATGDYVEAFCKSQRDPYARVILASILDSAASVDSGFRTAHMLSGKQE